MSLATGLISILRRYPYSASCALLSIALGALAWFLWGQNQELEVARQEKTKEGEAMLDLLVSGSTQRQELAGAREAAKRIEDDLLLETNLAQNYHYFYKLEEQTQARLQVHQLSSPPGDTSTLFKRIPYSLRISGTYEQVAAFLVALETGPRLINITSFSYARRDASGSSLALDLNVELLGKK